MKGHAASLARAHALWLVALVLLVASLTLAWGQNGQDRGIGGTGVVSDDQDGDRGIGGTGMMGRIRGFGSIIVNGVHVNYAPDVPVRIDGQARTVSDLKIGQVVRVVAENRNGVLATRQIDVTSEVVGLDRDDGQDDPEGARSDRFHTGAERLSPVAAWGARGGVRPAAAGWHDRRKLDRAAGWWT